MNQEIESRIKKDCFAYVGEKNSCEALEHLFCRKEYCSFYKTQEQLDEQQEQDNWRNEELGIERGVEKC